MNNYNTKSKNLLNKSNFYVSVNLRLFLQLVMPVIIVIFSLILLNISFLSSLIVLRFILGLIGFIFIPGYCISRLIYRFQTLIDLFGLSLALGTALQILSVLTLYAITPFLDRSINFLIFMELSTLIVVSIFSGITFKNKRKEEKQKTTFSGLLLMPHLNEYFFILIMIGLIILHVYFQSLSIAPVTDGASYLEYARNIVQTGKFTSHFIQAGSFLESTFTTGLTAHVGTPFTLAIFFEISGVSYLSGKIMLAFFGVLLFFPIFMIGKDFFNAKVGLIAGAIVTFSPFVFQYSSALYGPEIMATVFLAYAFYFSQSTIRKSNNWDSVFAAVFAFLTLITWYPNFFVFIFSIPIIYFVGKTVSMKKAIAVLAIVIYWLVTYQFSANLSFGLLFHVGTLAILIPIVILKRRDAPIKSLCIFLLIINFLSEVYWLRSFYYNYVFISPSSSLSGGAYLTSAIGDRVQTPSISGIFSNISNFIMPAYLLNVTTLVIVLGLLSFVFIEGLRKKLVIIIYPIIQLIFYAVFTPLDMMQDILTVENRLLLSTVIFSSILAAVFVSQLSVLSRQSLTDLKFNKRIKSKTLSIICIIIIIGSMFLVTYSQRYIDVSSKLKTSNINASYDLNREYDWLKENSSSDSVIASRKPYELGWALNRTTLIFDTSIDFDQLLEGIKEYNVSYLVVDPLFHNSYLKLQNLYTNPETVTQYFKLAFSYVGSDGLSYLIYNTTQTSFTTYSYHSQSINNFDNLTGLVTAYGLISEDFTEHIEGASSVKVCSVISPNWVNKSVAKFYQDLPTSNWSEAKQFNLCVKSNVDLADNLYFQIFDVNNNWSLYLLSYTSIGSWQNITINILSSSSHSANSPDLSKIQRIVLGVYEIPVPFQFWIDNLTFTYLVKSDSQN
jgi:hypothetical protein